MARPEKSPDMHELQGTKSQTGRHTGTPSNIPAGLPKFGQVSKQERRTFKRICGLLSERRHLTRGDEEIIRVYAAAEVRFHTFKALLDQEGWTVPGEFGFKANPVARDFYAAERVMIACLDRLGLTTLNKDKPRQAPDDAPKQSDAMAEILAWKPTPVLVPDIELEEPVEQPAEGETDANS